MQTQNQLKVNNKIKKSHVLVIGSFLVFIGVFSLFWNYFLKMRDEVFSDMRIAMMDDTVVEQQEEIEDVPVVENVDVNKQESENVSYVVDYSKYLGVLEIPKINLKRGFYNIDSKYNNIQYNVAMVEGSTLPDVVNGNLILMAHSGNAYYSYFAYLFKLSVGDRLYVTYAGKKYEYQIVNIYYVEKNGAVVIKRNHDKTSLTMITCTRGSDTSQTVYISELVG